jgi:hypothetical protein
MDEHTPHTDGAGPSYNLLAAGSPTSVPTGPQVLIRCLSASLLLVVGMSLMVWLFQDVLSGGWRSDWLATLSGVLLVILGAERLARGSRPRLARRTDRKPLMRALVTAHRRSVLPVEPSQRTAAGVLACQLVESAVMGSSAALGFGLAAVGRPLFPWTVAAAILLVASMIYALRAPRALAYLRALHAAERTG